MRRINLRSLLFVLFTVFIAIIVLSLSSVETPGAEDLLREDREFYTQPWGSMTLEDIQASINRDMLEQEKDMDVIIVPETYEFGMVFSFRWLKGECDGDNCYRQNRMWRVVYGVDLIGYIVSDEKYKGVKGVVGFCYEGYEDVAVSIIPFDFCREANIRAKQCDTVKKNVDYMEWLFDEINKFRTGGERYLPKDKVPTYRMDVYFKGDET